VQKGKSQDKLLTGNRYTHKEFDHMYVDVVFLRNSK